MGEWRLAFPSECRAVRHMQCGRQRHSFESLMWVWQLLCYLSAAPEVRACEGATDLICVAYVLVLFLGTKRDKQLFVVPKRVTNKRWMPFTYTVHKYLVSTGISLQSCNQEEDKPQPIALMWTGFNVPNVGIVAMPAS